VRGGRAERYRAANAAANNGKERKDLYSDNWDGDVYKGTEEKAGSWSEPAS
jgi:hypothetical protein